MLALVRHIRMKMLHNHSILIACLQVSLRLLANTIDTTAAFSSLATNRTLRQPHENIKLDRPRRQAFFEDMPFGTPNAADDMDPNGIALGDKTPFPPLPPNPQQSRLYHGMLTKPVSFMVSIQVRQEEKWYHICGATVISSNALLTAGHCFPTKYSKSTFRAVFGVCIIGSLPEDHERRFRYSDVHKDKYKRREDYYEHLYDNAVIVLPQDIDIGEDGIWPVCLASKEYDTEVYWGCGWGNFECTMTSNILRHAYGKLIGRRDCENKWYIHGNSNIAIHDSQICMMFETSYDDPSDNEYVSMDRGDSGGPVVAVVNGTRIQIGIASFIGKRTGTNPSCPTVWMPQIFSRVSYHREFITQWAPTVEFC